jgi:hypothetical protein
MPQLRGNEPILGLKKRRRLVDVAPHWGEPRISCVDVLCAMMLMLFMYLIS